MITIENQKRLIEVIRCICNKVLLDQNKEITVPELSLKEWNDLFSLASLHGMLPVLMKFFETQKVEDKELRRNMMKWFATAQKNSQRYQLRLQTMEELARLFGEHGIDVMFFKGAALAQLYPKPEWRVFSDIDFYLYGKWREGTEVMDGQGIKNRPYYHHNTEATLNGILLENHYDFLDRLNHRTNLILDDDLKRMVKEHGRDYQAGFLHDNMDNAYIMPPTMNAVFLLSHMSGHFVNESIPLRMLYDWILFLRAYATEVDWNRVTALYDAAGMTKFVGIVQGILQTRFDVVVKECPVKPLTGELVDRVWESVACPPEPNPHKMYTVPFFVYETKTFLGNRWKHQIVYPGESYFLLSFRYAWSVIKKKLGLLTIPEGR